MQIAFAACGDFYDVDRLLLPKKLHTYIHTTGLPPRGYCRGSIRLTWEGIYSR
ncbi:Protein of unknown function [Pyronema omphalodes CBS 100304]|uniref:Uncharacterized protein n=1 Tax=Pyronema omphalodes (strain CBS 100304) TaxID=1076935 RepID=U4KYD5_PYROM|nr:Protein of unknown function [Pyronema omphalodes CBS 100304]